MKRIALVLIVGLSATVAQADEFDIVDYGIFRSIDPLAQRDEWGTTHQTPHVNATDFAPRYAWRWEYYFKCASTTPFGSGLRWVAANGVASAGLLLRTGGRRIHTRSELRHCTAAKELFDACDRQS